VDASRALRIPPQSKESNRHRGRLEPSGFNSAENGAKLLIAQKKCKARGLAKKRVRSDFRCPAAASNRA
jgi:hypothetical protein